MRTAWKKAASVTLAGLLLIPAFGQQDIQDPVLRAMRDELERSRQLRVVDAAHPPYFIEYTLNDSENVSATASFGALMNSNSNRFRVPQVQVRVGSYERDQTGHVLSGFAQSTRLDPDQWPLDDDYQLIRQCLWLATDRAFKSAVDAYGRKEASLNNVSPTEGQPDFWKAEPSKFIGPASRTKVDTAKWAQMVTRLSAVFNDYPVISNSGVEGQTIQGITYLANNEGTLVRYPETVVFVRAKAEAVAQDGMPIRDAATFQALSVNGLPAEDAIRAEIKKVAENVKALAAAPLAESYSGPVLFEPVAAAQMFAQLLGDNLRVPRRPLSDPNRPVPFSPSELEGRIGSKILPAWINITDDGKRAKNGNQPLVGTYEFDMDGVPPKPVKVVEGGVLKSYLLTRQPVPGFNASTGHARLPGPFGARTAAISNLFVDATESVPATELKNQLIAMIKQRNKPYGLLVRKLDYPSSANPEDLRSLFSQASSKPLTPPTLVYRVYPDGREELVRGLRFRGVSSRTLRDIVAASKETAQFDFLNNAAVFALMAAGGFLAPTSVVSPGVLFEDMELERPQEAFQRGPIVPAPSLEK